MLLCISLSLIILGTAVREASFSIIGLVFLFVLSSAVLIPNDLDIKTGETITTTYTYDNTSISDTSKTNTNTYTNPDTRFYGVWLCIIAGAGLFLVWNGTRGEEF